MSIKLPILSNKIEDIISAISPGAQNVLIFGPPGIGKSTLTTKLAQHLVQTGNSCFGISADPGSPAFGIPGSITLGKWKDDSWQTIATEALCTLDAGRFRLPLITAVQRLINLSVDGALLIDAPGVARGIAGKELLLGLINATNIQTVLALSQEQKPPPLLDELLAAGTRVFLVQAAEEATRPGKRVRSRIRTEQWNSYLANGKAIKITLDTVNIIGTPPPSDVHSAWIGRQIALLHRNKTVAMAEILNHETNAITINLPDKIIEFDSLLIRDAQRGVDGLLETAVPFAAEALEYIPPTDVITPYMKSSGPRIVGRVGALTVSLINGVFGDPLLHLRIRHQRRSLLFDLGEGSRLSARIAHQITHVFISHAHMDHISGFLSLLRSRMGEFPPCSLYGPPGLANNIAGFVNGILWDRAAERAPLFIVHELHDHELQSYYIRAGDNQCTQKENRQIQNGIILQDSEFNIRAVTLDHGTPVIAYAYEPRMQLNIRKDRLAAKGLTPGKWLGELKQQYIAENYHAMIALPNGKTEKVEDLANDLILVTPGKKLVYATDFADTAENRERIIALAKNAHTLFCEASFLVADSGQAKRTGHLTTRACGEIATAAGVARLLPFHFSHRYIDDPHTIYDEIKDACNQLVSPKSMEVFNVEHKSEPIIDVE